MRTTSSTPPLADLVGRERDLEAMRAVVPSVDGGGGALLVVGDPGIGKSALLDVVADEASGAGTHVLRAAGAEFEAEVAFAALHQLLLPVRERSGALDAVHRDALDAIVRPAPGAIPDRLVICTATLALLADLAAERPVLVVVDDVGWLDRPSATVLGFVARRIAGTRTGLLAASRTDARSFFERGDVPELAVGPLDDPSSGHLVARPYPRMAPWVRRRILAEAGGNPLALLELSATLSESQRTARLALPDALPLSRRLQDLFESRIRPLPVPTRDLLLLAALDTTGDLRVLAADDRLDHLGPAERARLVHVDEGAHRVAFRHPLIRAAVVALATAGERRSAHRRLAAARPDDAERRAWHLAEATVGPDAAIADVLEQAARRIRRRGDAVGAIGWLTRAADLHPDVRARNRLLVEAAHLGADVAGDLGFASQLLAAAEGGGPTADESLVAALTAATVLLCADGDIETGHRLLLAAIERRLDERATADPLMVQAFDNLRVVCQFGARADLWAGLHAAVERLPQEARDAVRWSIEVGDDPARASAEALRHLDRAIEGLDDEEDTTTVARVVPQAFYVDRLPGCRMALRRTVDQGRDGTAVVPGMYALVLLAFDRYWAGDWEEASQLAAEGATRSEELGFGVLSWPAWYCQALLAAGRGEDAAVRSLTDRMVGAAAPRGARMVALFAHHALGLAALGRGDAEAAYEHAGAVSPAGALAARVPVALWNALDLVEAAVRTGRGDDAAAHVAAMRDANLASISPRLALVVGATAAMAADDDRSPALFEAALATPGAHRWPFDVARIELAHGERLRRARATGDARGHLAEALATFERIGATPWARRAGAELRAAGRSTTPSHRAGAELLTPQEHEIAALAASGLTNKEIGERLYLSHRTVGAHLYRIFPKLGVTSRAALRDALDG